MSIEIGQVHTRRSVTATWTPDEPVDIPYPLYRGDKAPHRARLLEVVMPFASDDGKPWQPAYGTYAFRRVNKNGELGAIQRNELWYSGRDEIPGLDEAVKSIISELPS